MIPVAGYCRVSTDGEDQANSFLSQQRYFRDYIEKQPDWQLHEIYADEGITGTSTRKRTQFNRMINDAHAGKFRMIVTKEVSRFSRNILDTISYTRELKAMGIGVIFVNDRINTMEPEAEMLLSFLASLAQEESRRTSARVVWGQTRQMERGVVFGHSLLGYRITDGRIFPEPEGAETVRRIFHQYAVQQLPAARIAALLRQEQCRTGSGSTDWTANAVLKILRNEKYVGDLIQKKTYTPDYLTHEKRSNRGQVPYVIQPNHHEPLVSRELWNRVQERLRRNNRHLPEDGGHSSRHVFSGKIVCGQCGSVFVSRYQYRKDGTKRRRWSCAAAARDGTQACSVGKLVRDDDAMQMLKTALESLPMDREAMIRSVTELALTSIRTTEPGGQQKPEQLRLEQIQRKREAVMDSYFSGEITKEDMQAMNRKYDSQMENLYRRKKEAEFRQNANRDSKELRTVIQAEVSDILNGEIESEVFCKTMLDSLTVFKDRHMELRLRFLPQVFQFAG
jgi:DNA invertase Pin-like site-specific DNA recombinase